MNFFDWVRFGLFTPNKCHEKDGGQGKDECVELPSTPDRIAVSGGEDISQFSNPHHPAMRVGDPAVLHADQPLAHFRRHLPDSACADVEFAIR